MQSDDQVFIEGEQIPDDRVLEIFQPPPGIPRPIARSSLVVGSRGSGKTTLFRYLKLTHERRMGVALHLALPSELSPVAKQTGCGPLEFDVPVADEASVVGKTVSLLAVGVLGRLLKRGFSFPELDALEDCLPASHQSLPRAASVEWVGNLRRGLAAAPIREFAGIAEGRVLPSLLGSLGEEVQRQRPGPPLLLLLDRADMLTTMCLVPLLEVLDQPANYLALVATRPGPVPRSLRYGSIAATPGDHFAALHLGLEPRSAEWQDFVAAAVAAQFGARLSLLAPHARQAIVWLCRDSPKLALEVLLALLRRGDDSLTEEEVYTALAEMRDTQLTVAQKTLQAYHPDYRAFVGEVRREARQKRIDVNCAVILHVEGSDADGILRHPSPIDRFLDIALRSGALATPPRVQWVPGIRLTDFEVPPLLVWHPEDGFPSSIDAPAVTIRRTERQLVAVRGGAGHAAPTIFFAYELKNSSGKNFRRDFDEALKRHPAFSHVEVTDGENVPRGARWPETIRKTISKAKAVIVDVTGLRPEVMFEMGFAFGLGKPTIPVLARPRTQDALPPWLAEFQGATYGATDDIPNLVERLYSDLSNPAFLDAPRPPRPVANSAVWLRPLPWAATAVEQFRTVAAQSHLAGEILDVDEGHDELIRRASKASLVLLTLDGTEDDALMHYVCGAVVAVPKVGAGRASLARTLILVPTPTVTGPSVVPRGIAYCHGTAIVARTDEVRRLALQFVQRLDEYRSRSAVQRRGRQTREGP